MKKLVKHIDYLYVTTPTGQYKIDASTIAKSIVKEQIKNSEDVVKSEDFSKKVDEYKVDEYRLIKWLSENSTWYKWKRHASFVNKDITTSDENFWSDRWNFEFVTETKNNT